MLDWATSRRAMLVSLLFALLAAPLCPALEAAPATLAELQAAAESRLQPAQQALDAQLAQLSDVTTDYAHWTDAYRFATGTRRQFPAAGLLAPALSGLDIHYIVVLDTSLQTRLSLSIDGAPPAQASVPADEALVRVLRQAVADGAMGARDQRLQGVLHVGGRQSLVVVQPVLRNGNVGKPGGWLALARALDTDALNSSLAAIEGAQGFAAESLPADLPQGIRAWLQKPQQTRIFSVAGEASVTTVFAVRDLSGTALWFAMIDTPIPAALRLKKAPPEPTAATANTSDGGSGLLLATGAVLAAIIGVGLWWRRRPAPLPAVGGPVASADSAPGAADILTGAPDGVIVATLGGRILTANPAAQVLLGGSEAELQSRNILGLLKRQAAGDVDAPLRLDQPMRQMRCAIVDAQGVLRSIELSVAPLPAAGGTTAALYLHEVGTAMPVATAAPAAAPAMVPTLPVAGTATRIPIPDAGAAALVEASIHTSASKLMVCYQPIVDVATGRVWGLEALPRWRRTPVEWISAQDAVTVDGGADGSLSIGQFVLRQVVEDAARWREQGAAIVPVGVNLVVSGRSLAETHVLLQKQFGGPVAARRVLRLELTGAQVDELDAWRALGLEIIVDQLHVRRGAKAGALLGGADAVKLTGSMLRSIDLDATAAATLASVASEAAQHDTPVICLDVERWQQLQLLASMGCQYAQGVVFAAPGTADDVVDFLKPDRFRMHVEADLSDTDEYPMLVLRDGS